MFSLKKFIFKNSKLSLNNTFKIFRLNVRYFTNLNENNTNKTVVTKPDSNISTDDNQTHSDFKPKVKQEITDDNVMKNIDDWVKNNDVVLFMKGTREMPRCGFSNYAVQILNFYKIKDFKVVNILESPILREAVKKYSNWPTYPQLYIKGNLVGGCDILKEMHENGTFKELVEREQVGSA